MTLDDFGDNLCNFCFCQVVSVITEAGLPQVFGANLVGGQVCTFLCISFGGQVTFVSTFCAHFFREKPTSDKIEIENLHFPHFSENSVFTLIQIVDEILIEKIEVCLQVLLQPTSETPEPDLKRRKRAR